MPLDPSPATLTHHFFDRYADLRTKFRKSVIYVCEHSERGALGLVINKWY
jgi:putative transcriptional regulator